ncbi:MAG: hypothetical protein ACXABO_21710 [Promethearchaeota archaeon]|jgi:hypothetical protein
MIQDPCQPKIFNVNPFLTLKLEEDGKTMIYVAGKPFRHCKYLLIDIPVDKSATFEDLESIDQAAERLDHSMEPIQDTRQFIYTIPPEVEFWGHSSNLQVWYENNYNSRLLHRNLAFPLLEQLVKAGDRTAIRVFKEEIAKRLESGFPSVVNYLIEEKYCNYLKREELLPSLLEPGDAQVISEIEEYLYGPVKTALRPITRKKLKLHLVLEEPIFEEGIPPSEAKGNAFSYWVRFVRNAFAIRLRRVIKLKITMIPEGFELPENISKLTTLEELYIHDNWLTKLPYWIDSLKNLRLLEIWGNRFDLKYLKSVVDKFKKKGVKVVIDSLF